jgi:tetratricopeptide (TPR) repeat protein
MRNTKAKALFISIAAIGLLLLNVCPALPEKIIINSEDQFDFAQTLMKKGDYNLAIGEFGRFIHFFPNDPYVKKARLLIGMCHLQARRHEDAREIFSQIIRSEQDRSLSGKAVFLTGESYYQQGVSKESEYYFRQVMEQYSDPDLKNAALYRLGWARMQANKWSDASEFFNQVEKESRLYESSRQLVEQSLKGNELPEKNPAYAGVLAALVPGLGHAYVSRYKDATVAFVVNGLFIWAAIQSFHKDQAVLGGILTFLEVGWYSGNIYSAVNTAHKYNRKVQNDFRGDLEDRLDLGLFTARRGQIGLSLTFHF